jgi:hypothetical protein
LANYVARYWWRDPNTTGFANAMFLGNFWADFGAVGVASSCFMVGFIIHWLYYRLINIAQYKKNIIFVIFSTVTVPVSTFNFFSSNFTSLLITRGLLALLFLFLIVEKLSKMLFEQDVGQQKA